MDKFIQIAKFDKDFKTTLDLRYYTPDSNVFEIFLSNSKQFLRYNNSFFTFTKKGHPTSFIYQDNTLYALIKGEKKIVKFALNLIQISEEPFYVELYKIKRHSKIITALKDNDTENIINLIEEKKYDFQDYVNGSMIISSLKYSNYDLLEIFLTLGLNPNQIFEGGDSKTLLTKCILDFCKLSKKTKIMKFLCRLLENSDFDINSKHLDLDNHPYNLIYNQYKLQDDKEKFKEIVGPLIKFLNVNGCSFENIKSKRVTILKDMFPQMNNTEMFTMLMSNEALRADSELLSNSVYENDTDYANYEDIPILTITEKECLLLIRAYNGDFKFTSQEYKSLFKTFSFFGCDKMYHKLSLLIYCFDPNYEINLFNYNETQLVSFPDTTDSPNIKTKQIIYQRILSRYQKIVDERIKKISRFFIRPTIINELSNEIIIYIFLTLDYIDVYTYLLGSLNYYTELLLNLVAFSGNFEFFKPMFMKYIDSMSKTMTKILSESIFEYLCGSNNIENVKWGIQELNITVFNLDNLLLRLIYINVDIEICQLIYAKFANETFKIYGDNLFIKASINCNKEYIEWIFSIAKFEKCYLKMIKADPIFFEFLKDSCRRNNKPLIIDSTSIVRACQSRDLDFVTLIYNERNTPGVEILDQEAVYAIFFAIIKSNSPAIFDYFLTQNDYFSTVIEYGLRVFLNDCKKLNLIEHPHVINGLKWAFERFNVVELIMNSVSRSKFLTPLLLFSSICSIETDKVLTTIMDYFDPDLQKRLIKLHLQTYKVKSPFFKFDVNKIIFSYLDPGELLDIFEDSQKLASYELIKNLYPFVKETIDTRSNPGEPIFVKHNFLKGNTPVMDLLYPIYPEYIKNNIRNWYAEIYNESIKYKTLRWMLHFKL